MYTFFSFSLESVIYCVYNNKSLHVRVIHNIKILWPRFKHCVEWHKAAKDTAFHVGCLWSAQWRLLSAPVSTSTINITCEVIGFVVDVYRGLDVVCTSLPVNDYDDEVEWAPTTYYGILLSTIHKKILILENYSMLLKNIIFSIHRLLSTVLLSNIPSPPLLLPQILNHPSRLLEDFSTMTKKLIWTLKYIALDYLWDNNVFFLTFSSQSKTIANLFLS